MPVDQRTVTTMTHGTKKLRERKRRQSRDTLFVFEVKGICVALGDRGRAAIIVATALASLLGALASRCG